MLWQCLFLASDPTCPELVVLWDRRRGIHGPCEKVWSFPLSSHLAWGGPQAGLGLTHPALGPVCWGRVTITQMRFVRTRALCGSELEWVLSIFVINTLMLTGDSGVLSIHRGHICPGRENSSKEKQPSWGSWWWVCHSKKSTIYYYIPWSPASSH